MRIPRNHRLNIGGHIFTIKLVDDDHPILNDIGAGDGACDLECFTIYLNRHRPAAYLEFVFGHEVEHALHMLCGLELSEPDIATLHVLRDGMYKLNRGL